MSPRQIKLFIVITLIFCNIGCDQATKHVIGASIDKTKTTSVVGDLFVLKYAENTGAFLSLGSALPARAKPVFMVALPLVMMLALLVMVVHGYVVTGAMPGVSMFAFCCILGGGLGNMYDRLTNNGMVVDFMNFGIGSLRTGILNFADLSITLGVVTVLAAQALQGRALRSQSQLHAAPDK
ncbi:MAG: signal peptidase II [Candidatus Raymondbacteria bacterium RifOxyC12_full_50_8]|uniref:Lipoprotein signal peptidase n=1 Tax=Candidatus Raymondbacteria bacterium RIFOXYD12_FULL_49_13 TaxID=1817890 RepID=A0A1F7FF62_UNCRA|nr:MAG: signal peptidase II [Candidatus Raymondbacteria bacterium RIFOXYA2_FULL_49_16]OGK01042.1 MAG: signal peptidase II [Candidatus Raymondbacteria bacterium RifOxyB12_full_50_8]OGK03392.1 MAG: signal peptidase II [Candidatus Raymondbacteria bacterium RifOxyC12_full_50_8]OGK05340.1 MAG: signal peptidase II [Candidatus Raymondbacteria bacterium RIFOXYD12_FULL_49_13]OGP42953.1 MAG: signal peptidase II [Candidatus Raymondbacteria bacterium RIFOXYB2_FULL_49_35]